MKCNQAICELVATHRYVWPGAECLSCEKHGALAKSLASAMGLDLEVTPIFQDADGHEYEWRCPDCKGRFLLVRAAFFETKNVPLVCPFCVTSFRVREMR